MNRKFYIEYAAAGWALVTDARVCARGHQMMMRLVESGTATYSDCMNIREDPVAAHRYFCSEDNAFTAWHGPVVRVFNQEPGTRNQEHNLDSFFAPLDGYFANLIRHAEDPEISDAELLDLIEVAVQALPTLLPEMDIDALAKLFESAMGGTALEAVKTGLPQKNARNAKNFSAFSGGEIQLAPLAEAIAKLAAKTPIAQALTSAQWAKVPAEIADRGQFSARVASARVLGSIQNKLGQRVRLEREQLANGKTAGMDRSVFIGEMKAVAREEGISTAPPNQRGTVRDIHSATRLGLIYDMQNAQINGYARHKMDQDPDVLDAFPALRFERVESREKPRTEGYWPARFRAAAAAVGGQGVATGALVALKSSPVWTALSIFGTPWPPFDWGSGWGTVDVDRAEAEDLGLITAGEDLMPDDQGFNTNLEADIAELAPKLVEWLKATFGDKLNIVGDVARWVG